MDLAAAADSLRRLALATGTRAPLYSRLAEAVAGNPEVLSILAGAPATHRAPVGLLAAVHYLLLADPGQPLAGWYPNLTDRPRTDDPVAAFEAFCAARRDEIVDLVSTRLPQTNEIGRSALLLVGLASLAGVDTPLAHLDVGASAGLNLLIEHYGYDFSGRRLGPDRLVLGCEVSGGKGPLPAAIPRFGGHLGLDRDPVDLSDPAQVRWLEACVWPDQADRFERLRTAIGLGREVGVRVRGGDAVSDLGAALDELGGAGHPVVTTSWVLTYLTDGDRAAFQEVLAARGARSDLSWVFAEAPAYAPGLPYPPGMEASELTVLATVSWRDGVRRVRHLATCHPHGYTLRWLPRRGAVR
ncbi:MAG: DUF2332 domain-containing protein [Propionicimonas sp.]|nr:DUF2332 domain-containing protein [Propionicimonas sp.]